MPRQISAAALKFYDSYKLVMDHDFNPLKNIPDPVSRMWIMIVLAWLWSVAFGLYVGSMLYAGLSLVAHVAILFMVFFTASVFYDAEKHGHTWLLKLRRPAREHAAAPDNRQ